jgi:RNA polymerase sigma-70 factor (ECF subfamily)
MDALAEAELTHAARAGDAVAFDALLDPLMEAGYRLAFTMLRDRQAAEDVVQEAAFKAWKKFHQFRHGESARPWFLTIVANECRSLLRGRWWNVLKRAEMPDLVGHDAAAGLAAGTDLRRSLEGLSFEHRLVLYLYFCEDLEQAEIARMLGVRVGTVKSRIYRAIQKLRADLEVEEAPP